MVLWPRSRRLSVVDRRGRGGKHQVELFLPGQREEGHSARSSWQHGAAI